MKKKLTSLFLVVSLLFGSVSGLLPVVSFASGNVEDYVIEENDVPLKLYYDEEASHGLAQGYDDVDTSFGSGSSLIDAHPNDDWERWSIPLGNGYFGANVFGRTGTERIQLTEKTLANPYRITNGSANTDGLNNFSETYIDFGHANASVSNYSRELDLETAISSVSYKYNGVTYTREYFTSYPDKAMIIKLDASSAGALDFVLRPTVPYEQEYMNSAGDRGGKTGTVTSSVADGVGYVTLSGKLEYFDIDFVGLYKVYTNGGSVTATTCTNADGDTDGTITVSGATSAYIVITMGTDYELVSEQFSASGTNKPTFSTGIAEATAKVQGYMDAVDTVIAGKSFDDAYAALKSRHLADYQELFGRVTLDLDFDESDFALTTDQLLTNYKNGSGSRYLEALYFQYGRYLLIASSRKGALPANLQGAWNRYNHAPWSGGYWHNINVQMNYWPAFSTNIAETFEAYVDYNKAYMAKAQSGSNSIVNQYNPSVSGTDGGNGWSIATGGYVSDVSAATSIGNLGFTTQLFWEYYEYTKDETLLREVVYPVLVGAARFITKMVKEDADGNYIAIYTDSPEQYVNGVWYYTDKGTAYAQSMAYQNNYNMLLAAKELGISFEDTAHEDYAIIQTVLEQIDKYDPIRVGLSGQVKEFFEEDYYGDMGEYNHRHLSQLVGLYPGNVINGNTPAWLDAAEYSLTERGDGRSGWSSAHRLLLWARLLDGEKAHYFLNELLTVYTATNLWDIHPPFQIDGNLGGTAAIAEMLLQSHAGYIEPLAALPSAWANGSYTGLVAKGNFEVSAAWADGLATSFNIKSLAGGEVSVKYGGIQSATVKTLGGKTVSYTKNSNGTITFDTEVGETYVIWGFEKQTKPASVTNLAVESEFLSKSTLTWTASADAVAYNVYVAKDNASVYTLLATTKNTSYVYNPGELENSRLTFAVTAVNTQGVESKRALAYRNPCDTSSSVEEIAASVVDNELQVAIKSNEYASKYRLYSRKNSASAWTLVQESSYPIIIEEAYDSLLKYGVSVVSFFGEESEIAAISSYSNAPVSVNYEASNIFLGNEFVPTSESEKCVHSADYHHEKLTDGNFDSKLGRFSTTVNTSSLFDATMVLPASFLLGELRIYDFSPSSTTANYAGTSLTIEIFYEGVWTTVINCQSNDEIIAYRNPVDTRYLSFDLSGHKAQQIRIRIPAPVSGNSISLYEIECSGLIIPTGKTYNDNLLLGKDVYLSEYSTKYLNSASGNKEKLTDGILKRDDANTFYTWYNQTDAEFDALIGFDGEVLLNTLRIYDYRGETNWANSVGPEIIIQVGLGDTWTTVHDVTIVGGSGNNINQYRKYGTRPNSDTGVTEYWLEFNLEGVKADRLRIYMPPRSTGNFGMYEIECDGYCVENSEISYESNVLLNKEFVPTTSAAGKIWKGTYADLTDGANDDNNRLATSGTASFVDGTLSFGDFVASLDTLTIDYGSTYTQARCGTGLIIEMFNDGVWTEVLNVTYDTAVNGKVTYDLGHATGSLMRIYVPGVYPTASGSFTAGDCIVIHEISCAGSLAPAKYNVEVLDNVFLNKTFVAGSSSGNVWSGSYANMTDGNNGTRAAVNTAVDATVDLGDVYSLSQIDIKYDSGAPKRCGAEVQIQVYYEGSWTTAATVTHTSTVTSDTINLGGVKAEKVRLYIPAVYSDDTVTGDCMVIYEISCTGAKLTEKINSEQTDDVFTELEFVPTDDTAAGNIWSPNTYDKLTDNGGVTDGNSRFATANGHTADGTLDFNGKIAVLNTLTVNFDPYTAARCGKDFNIYVYRNGEWTLALSHTHTETVLVETFDLGGVEAEKVRFTVTGKYDGGDCIVIYEMSCTGELITPEVEYEDKNSNILLGISADRLSLENATAHTTASVHDLTNAFDGDTTTTRFAVANASGPYSLVIDLQENIPLYTLRIYDWRGESTTRSDNTKIELYVDDCWVPVVVGQPLTTEATFTEFDLMGTLASKLRITFHNTQSNDRATIYEITCTTGSASAIDRSELLEAYKALDAIETNGDAVLEEMKAQKLESLESLLTDTEATSDDVAAYVESVKTETAKIETGIPANESLGNFESQNLSLSSDIGVHFYGNFTSSVIAEFPEAIVVIQYADGMVEKQKLSALSTDAQGRLVLSIGLTASQMTETVKVGVVFDSDNRASTIETSVRAYADKILADSSYEAATPGINDLVKAMLDYGSYAQQYFGYNVENLANAGIYADEENPVENGDFSGAVAEKPSREGSVSGITPAGWTLALDSDIKIRFYFATYNVHKYEFTVTKPDGTVETLAPLQYEETVYRVEIGTDDAALIDNTYVLTIRDLENGSELDISFNAMMYVNTILSGSVSSTTQLSNVAKAIKLYCEAADVYNSNK